MHTNLQPFSRLGRPQLGTQDLPLAPTLQEVGLWGWCLPTWLKPTSWAGRLPMTAQGNPPLEGGVTLRKNHPQKLTLFDTSCLKGVPSYTSERRGAGGGNQCQSQKIILPLFRCVWLCRCFGGLRDFPVGPKGGLLCVRTPYFLAAAAASPRVWHCQTRGNGTIARFLTAVFSHSLLAPS